MLIRSGGAGDGSADVRRGSRRGSSGVRGKGNRHVHCDGRGRNQSEEPGKQVVQYIADSAATCIMTPDADGLTNYRECIRGLANGGTTSVAGHGELTVAFRSDNGWVHEKLHDIAHAPLLSYNLISLPSLALKGHTYAGDKDGVTLQLEGGRLYTSPCLESFAAITRTAQMRRIGW